MKKAMILASLLGLSLIVPGAAWGQEETPAGEIREDDLLIRHSELRGSCRQTNRRLDVFAMPGVQHQVDRVAVLGSSRQVTLTGWGANGWVEISAPTEGYVIARHLALCPGDRADTPIAAAATSNLDAGDCRVAMRDLAIRSRPTRPARTLGGVPGGTSMTLTGETQYDPVNRRTWLEISAPKAGWVSGSVGTATNVRSCR